MATSKLQALWNHPAGPKTTVTATGLIWSRYSTVITPKNWNLLSVNVAMACTGLYQLSRKIRHDYSNTEQAVVAEE
ncbi:mitochondrial pyruvate carrier 3 isoform X2 [Coffea eugenioides]|uniref:Mitochondrial pyruvate carrier n=1 Tax=Coffea arabica TaxID=13443 RepID=A0ABM4VPS5_COFAR|nr:mitochondrial pyruvate carrier 3 isoform X2 [Coffea eugenioides]